MKIAFINEKYLYHSTGGAQQSVRILAESLVGKGHEISVWTTTHRPEHEMSVEMHGGVRVVHLPVANVYWPHERRPAHLKPLWHAIDAYNPFMAKHIGRLLDAEKPDVLHTNIVASFSSSVWGQAHRRGVPVVHTLRDHYLRCPSGAMFTARGNCSRQCSVCKVLSVPKKFATRHVGAVVGISNYLLQAHLSRGYFGESHVRTVIHNSYACDGSLPARKDPSTSLRIGYLGRLFETKGIELLIDAVTHGFPGSSQLFVAGSGDPAYEARLRERCACAPGKVTFLGDVPPRTLFEQIDVLVVPSLWHEPFGRVAIEANAWGIPVVASRRGGLPEIVEPGVTGFLFEPDRDGALARTLRELTPARCRAMRAACLHKARQFLPEVIAGQYETLYHRLIESAPAATLSAEEIAGTPLAPTAHEF